MTCIAFALIFLIPENLTFILRKISRFSSWRLRESTVDLKKEIQKLSIPDEKMIEYCQCKWKVFLSMLSSFS
jgi:hypothetical protein